MRILNDSRGTVHIWGTVLLILAIVGAGYLYSSYKEKKLSSDVPKVMAAYEAFLDDNIKDPEDRAKLKQALKIVTDLACKYNPAGISLDAVKQIEKQQMILERGESTRREK